MMKDPKQKESLKNIMTHLMPKEVVKMLHKEIPATKSLSEEEVDLDEDIKGYKPHVASRDTLSYHLPKQKKR